MTATPSAGPWDAIVVGAGFAGLYMLHSLRRLGFSAICLEAAPSVGGTWYNNRYPGLRCDIESLMYSYSFDAELQRDWTWTERYPAQAEILKYLNHVADRFALRDAIRLETRVAAAVFDEADNRWAVTTAAGDELTARFVVMATGCLSVSYFPFAEEIGAFKGEWVHTGAWPEAGVDFAGKRVGVVGTGSSGIQCIPVIAQEAAHLTVFQRTASFAAPAHNRPLEPAFVEEIKGEYDTWRARNRVGQIFGAGDLGLRDEMKDPPVAGALAVSSEERQARYEKAWARGGAHFAGTFPDLLVNAEANETAADFIRGKIRQTVKDPRTAEALCPRDFRLATKRVCVDTDYYATFNRANVTLVNLKEEPLEGFTQTGVRTAAGDYPLDLIVFATGFDAMTGALLAIDIRGVGGRRLKDKWAEGPKTFMGLAMAGFPNLFTVTGPGSPSVLSNMVLSIEQHVEWIAACLGHLRDAGVERIEATPEAEAGWVAHGAEIVKMTLFADSASWYAGTNIPGKPPVFMVYLGGGAAYREACERVATTNYEGFRLN